MVFHLYARNIIRLGIGKDQVRFTLRDIKDSRGENTVGPCIVVSKIKAHNILIHASHRNLHANQLPNVRVSSVVLKYSIRW